MRKFTIIFIAFIFCSSASADLTLRCNVRSTDVDGAVYNYIRVIELLFDTHTATFYDDHGRGLDFVNRYQFISADSNRILLRDDSVAFSYIDRVSGAYYYKDNKETVVRGSCEKSSKLEGKF